jgi:hypothetical protein
MKISKERREHWEQNTRDDAFNRWLKPQITGPGGALDLDRLYAVAEGFGLDGRDRYAHLNPGQQRMTLGNRLRRAVPRAVYENGAAEAPPAAAKPPAVAVPEPRDPNAPLARASVRELLRLHGEVMEELRFREVVRTSNNPVGDYAELLFSRAFGWTLEGSSAAGFDAKDEAGLRYQIKARRLTRHNGSRQLSFLRGLPDRKFDFLAAVLFDARYGVLRAIITPHEGLEARCRYSAHANGWLLRLEDDCWQAPGAREVTAEIQDAAAAV